MMVKDEASNEKFTGESIPCGTDKFTTAGPTLAAAFAMVSLPKQ